MGTEESFGTILVHFQDEHCHKCAIRHAVAACRLVPPAERSAVGTSRTPASTRPSRHPIGWWRSGGRAKQGWDEGGQGESGLALKKGATSVFFPPSWATQTRTGHLASMNLCNTIVQIGALSRVRGPMSPYLEEDFSLLLLSSRYSVG